MDGYRGLGTGTFGEAHDRPARFVEPVVQVLDVVLALRGDVLLVRAGHVFGGDLAGAQTVDI